LNKIGLEVKQTVLYTGPLQSLHVVQEALGKSFAVEFGEPDPEKLLPKFQRCDVFIDASMKVRIPANVVHRAMNLKLVATATTGANHIDELALNEKGIPLLTLKGQPILLELSAAAEHSWLLLMACARRLRNAIHHVEQGEWDRVKFPGIMLKDKILGIIGFGRIGSFIAKYGEAFGMKVIAYDQVQAKIPKEVKFIELDDLLGSADFITVHVNLTADNAGMLNRDRVQRMKKGAVFINTSRGELVDENALVEALRLGNLAAVGVDVLIDEPEISKSPLWQYALQHQNVIITPHIGGYCPEALERALKFTCNRVLEYFGMV
jgi:D-3-phosphoglycerate dehydrogenase